MPARSEHSKKRSPTTGYLNGKGRPTTDKARLAGVTEREQPGFASLTENEAADHFTPNVARGRMVGRAGLACPAA